MITTPAIGVLNYLTMKKKLAEKQYICNLAKQWAELVTDLMNEGDAIELVCSEHTSIIYYLAAFYYAFYHNAPLDKANIDNLITEMLCALDIATQNENKSDETGTTKGN